MPRFRLTIEYDGTPFVGWQRQDNGPSVQQALEQAIERFCGASCAVTGAGRTDAGVHALGQVAHVDLPRAVPPATVRDALNFHLRPDPVAVLEVAEVETTFHARFCATGRHYLYRILNRRAGPALDRQRVWWVAQPLNLATMRAAAQHLVGRHDFNAFRSTACQSPSSVKTLDLLTVERCGAEIHIRAKARSFLHNQVRILVGTLKRVGEGAWSPADVAAALASRDRRAAGPTAPPQGLYLVAVDYGEALPLRAPAAVSHQSLGRAVDQHTDDDVEDDEAGGGQPRHGQQGASQIPKVARRQHEGKETEEAKDRIGQQAYVAQHRKRDNDAVL
jgi:tRNA pseudouridine38-40 synthase